MAIHLSLAVGAVILLTFALERVVGGIFSEYGKRFWFGTVEPWMAAQIDRLLRALGLRDDGAPSAQHDVSENERVLAERRELEALLNRVLIERDFLQGEVIRLQVTLSRCTISRATDYASDPQKSVNENNDLSLCG